MNLFLCRASATPGRGLVTSCLFSLQFAYALGCLIRFPYNYLSRGAGKSLGRNYFLFGWSLLVFCVKSRDEVLFEVLSFALFVCFAFDCCPPGSRLVSSWANVQQSACLQGGMSEEFTPALEDPWHNKTIKT